MFVSKLSKSKSLLSTRFVHTIARAPSQAINRSEGVVVYDSPEFKCKLYHLILLI